MNTRNSVSKLTSEETQHFIMNCGYFAKPASFPTVEQRFYHAGSAESDMWLLVGKKRTPAYSRIERQFRKLQAMGWLHSAPHPDYPTVWGWMLAPALVDGFNIGVIRSSADLFAVSDEQSVLLRMVDVEGAA